MRREFYEWTLISGIGTARRRAGMVLIADPERGLSQSAAQERAEGLDEGKITRSIQVLRVETTRAPVMAGWLDKRGVQG